MDKEEVEAAITALESSVRTIDTWVLIFSIGVAVSLGAEVVLGVAHWWKDRELRPLRAIQGQLHEKELAKLRNISDEANARAREAGKEN